MGLYRDCLIILTLGYIVPNIILVPILLIATPFYVTGLWLLIYSVAYGVVALKWYYVLKELKRGYYIV